MEYSGYKEICMSDSDLAQFYSGDYIIPEIKDNQYIILTDELGMRKTTIFIKTTNSKKLNTL